ncbi:MAG: type II toxin-antitoxin system RelE/ParE family toxin [Acidobacteria bacterium]|nr:type II toxin-antitoxin system RelE/ParE family toxin [Acidobacteriota bacterium]
MILSFKDAETERVFTTGKSKRFGPVARTAARRLGVISFAKTLEDLRNPPGNRLEALKGDRKGQYSIRINDQYRVCFRWDGQDASDVEIVDYH